MLETFPKIRRLGEGGTYRLLKPGHPVIVEEKIDGAQISWIVNEAGELSIFGRHDFVDLDNPPTQYRQTVERLQSLVGTDLLTPGLIYRGEVVSKPKAVTLAYDRAATHGVLLWDVQFASNGQYLMPNNKQATADLIGLECAPTLHNGSVDMEILMGLLQTAKPLLGGEYIEGVVLKDATNWSPDRQFAKYVSDRFLESHLGEKWNQHVSGKEMVQSLASAVTTPARLTKILHEMKDDGMIDGTLKDIGPLCTRVRNDVVDEETEALHRQLNWYWADRPLALHKENDALIAEILTSCNTIVALWYKEQLKPLN